MSAKTVIYHDRPRQTQSTSGSRTSSAMAIRLTLRDLQILEALFTARYMTTQQLCKLFWKDGIGTVGPRKACARRLKKLRDHGLIRFIEQPVIRAEPSKPYIWTLDKGGADLLSSELGIDPKEIDVQPPSAQPTYPFLAHLLRTNDFRIAVVLACEQHGLTLVEWVDEKVLKSEGMKDYVWLQSPEGKRYKAAVVPDAYFMIQRGASKGRALFFLEIDEATVTVSPSVSYRRGWRRKIRAYLAYFSSEAYQKRYGDRPARVLTVTTSDQRLQHLKEASEAEGAGQRFWFARADDATDPARLFSEKIWYQAGSSDRFSLLS